MKSTYLPALRRLTRAFCRAGAAAPLLLLAAGGVARAEQTQAPRADEVVAVAFEADGALLKSSQDALHRSENGGREWMAVPMPAADGDGRVMDIAVPAGASESVFYLAGPGLGVQRTENAGDEWTALNEGLPSRELVAFAAHADRPETLYAVIAKEGIYRSEDAGASWQMMDKGPKQGLHELIHSDMEGSMQSGWLFAATPEGVQRAMDCFCLWRDAGDLSGEVSAIAYDPRQPARLFAAAGDVLHRSTDGGESWEAVAAPGGTVTALTLTPEGALYAGTENGGLFRRTDEGGDWEEVDG